VIQIEVCATVEDISDEAIVSRLILFPQMYSEPLVGKELHWPNVFQFQRKYSFRESLVWRQYASEDQDVHWLGEQQEKRKRENATQQGKNNTNIKYKGFISAKTEHIRAISTTNGYRFFVEHVPKEGRYHAEVGYASADATPPAEKADLKMRLKNTFSEIVAPNAV
jgi:hypothetical protein